MSVLSLTDYRPSPRYDGVAWVKARIEGSTSATGPWEAVETFELAPDADPSKPQDRSFTTEEAVPTQEWFRVVFVDPDGNEELTDALALVPTKPLATPRDVASRLGRDLTESEGVAAAFLLDAASAVIGEAAECDPAIIDPVPRVFKFVAVELVLRALANPRGLVSNEKTLGQYSHAERYREGQGADLLLTRTEELMIRRAVGVTQGSQRVESHVDDVFGALVGS